MVVETDKEFFSKYLVLKKINGMYSVFCKQTKVKLFSCKSKPALIKRINETVTGMKISFQSTEGEK